MLVDHRLPLSFQPQLSTFLGLSGYVGEPVVNCSIMGESCFTEAQFGGFGCPAMGCCQHKIDMDQKHLDFGYFGGKAMVGFRWFPC